MEDLKTSGAPELAISASGVITIDSFGTVFINGKQLSAYISDVMGFQSVEIDGYKTTSFSGSVLVSIVKNEAEPEIVDTLSESVEFV